MISIMFVSLVIIIVPLWLLASLLDMSSKGSSPGASLIAVMGMTLYTLVTVVFLLSMFFRIPENIIEIIFLREKPILVFLSYCNDDIEKMEKLRLHLLKSGVFVQEYTKDMIGGESIMNWIQAEIKKTHVLVLLLSLRTLNSNWVLKEIQIAKSKKIPIVPYCLDPWEKLERTGSSVIEAIEDVRAIWDNSQQTQQKMLIKSLSNYGTK